MWIAYYHKAFDSDGRLIYGAGGENYEILARWELEKIDDIWTVTKIKEAP